MFRNPKGNVNVVGHEHSATYTANDPCQNHADLLARERSVSNCGYKAQSLVTESETICYPDVIRLLQRRFIDG